MPAPANDLCVNAQVIASLPFTVTGLDNSLATETAGDPTNIFAGDGSVAGAATLFKTVFYTYTPGSTETIRITCNQNGIDFGVYTGSCGSLVEVASHRRQLTIELTGGTPYTFVFGSEANTGITFNATIAISTAPSHQIVALAKTISALPFTASVGFTGVSDEVDAYPFVVGKSRHVWYKWTAAADGVISVYGSGNLTTFVVISDAFTTPFNIFGMNPVGGPNAGYSYSAQSVPFYMPVTSGETYYFSFGRDQATAITDTLSVSIEEFVPTAVVPAGSIAIPDDGSFHPLAIIDPATGDVLRYVPPGSFAASESGAVLPDGRVLMLDPGYGYNGTPTGERLVVYAADFASELASLAVTILDADASPITASPAGDGWYVASIGTLFTVTKYDTDLNVIGSWVVAGDPNISNDAIMGIAVSPDESILYYTMYNGVTSSAIAASVLRWDLVNNIALSALASFVAGLAPTREMIAMADGSVVVSYWDPPPGTTNTRVLRYSAAGAVLNTYTRSDVTSFEMRMSPIPTDATAFALWTKIAGGLSRFETVRASDGVVLTTISIPHYTSGLSSEAATLSPTTRFGFSFSCPFFILPTSFGTDPDAEICPTVQTQTPFNIDATGATFYGTVTNDWVAPQLICTKVWFEWAETIADPPAKMPPLTLDPAAWPNPAFVLRFPRPRRATTYVYRAATRICAGVVTTCPTHYGDWVPFELPALGEDEDGVIGPLAFVRWGRRQP